MKVAEFSFLPFELGWVTGFLQGEGSFHVVRVAHPRKNGSVYKRRYAGIAATQKENQPLLKLRDMMQGTICRPRHQSSFVYGKYSRRYWRWTRYGPAVSQLMRDLRPYLSPRRQQQIDRVLSEVEGG